MRLIRGDCKEVLPRLQKSSIDLVLIDPPYVLDTHGGTQNKDLQRKIHANHIKDISSGFDYSVFELCEPLLKSPNYLVFCSNKQISSLMRYFESKNLSTTLLCWHKPNPVPFANGKHLSDLEFIVYARGKGAHFNNELPISKKSKVYTVPSTNRGKLHPTEKPLTLIQEMILLHSFEGDVVLDFYSGSGTTGVACKSLNREFIGIEIEPEYHKIAKSRIREAVRGSAL